MFEDDERAEREAAFTRDVEPRQDDDLRHHDCDRSESWWEHDAQGIPLCRVCDVCRDVKLARYRPEILSGYDQSDVDEPIEEAI